MPEILTEDDSVYLQRQVRELAKQLKFELIIARSLNILKVNYKLLTGRDLIYRRSLFQPGNLTINYLLSPIERLS